MWKELTYLQEATDVGPIIPGFQRPEAANITGEKPRTKFQIKQARKLQVASCHRPYHSEARKKVDIINAHLPELFSPFYFP